MKKFLSILLAAIMIVCIAVPAFAADETTTKYPGEYTINAANAGVHVLDGVISDGEYDIAIEDYHKDNEFHTYYHLPAFNPAHGKDFDSLSNWYIGYDVDNLYFGLKVVDSKRAISEETGLPVDTYLRAAVTFWIGNPQDAYSYGVQIENKRGSVILTENYEGSNSDRNNGAKDFNLEWSKYNEVTNEDETVSEIWEIMIPFSYLREYIGVDSIGTELYFAFFEQPDNAYEESIDRNTIGANEESGLPKLDDPSYSIGNPSGRPFKLTIGHVCTFAPTELEGGHQGTCSCGKTEGDVVDHEWDPGIVSKDPTTTEEGEFLYTCYDCGAEKTEAIAKLDPPADSGNDDNTADDSNTSDDTNTGDNTTDDTTDDAKGGCGASVTAMGLALVATLGLGVTVLSKKN